MNIRACGLIPIYNHRITIAAVVEEMLHIIDFIIIVDDASNDGSEVMVDQLKATYPNQIHVIHHQKNTGKGGAVQSGLHSALNLSFTHAIQVDADGQHDLLDLPKFLQAAHEHPDALSVGVPIYGDDIPMIRKYGRKLTQAILMLEMGTYRIPDGMIGFRTYPVAAICALGKMDPRMSFDPEVMIRAHWAKIPMHEIPTHVCYLAEKDGGVSHFRMVEDNIRHTWIHIRLLLQAPFRLCIRCFK